LVTAGCGEAKQTSSPRSAVNKQANTFSFIFLTGRCRGGSMVRGGGPGYSYKFDTYAGQQEMTFLFLDPRGEETPRGSSSKSMVTWPIINVAVCTR
jgi:hypothetical protein